MESISVQKASQIDHPAREWLQRLFGRLLSEDEQVTILVARSHAAPDQQDRQGAFQRMESVLDRAAKNMRDVPEEEFNAALDEAMNQIRKRER